MIADPPKAETLRELLLEIRGGFMLHKPILIALELMRAVDADVLTAADPAPQRSTLFRIHADQIIGRASRTAE